MWTFRLLHGLEHISSPAQFTVLAPAPPSALPDLFHWSHMESAASWNTSLNTSVPALGQKQEGN